MKKVDIFQEGMKIPKIEYNVYSKLNGTKLIKLNLTICENSKISISVPVSISKDLDKLNISSSYFNDICYSSTSESGTDIIIKDRKKEFIDNNKTICQEDCDFSDYDYDFQKANCSCQVKESKNSYADMNINKTKLNENLGNINNKNDVSNLKITSCNVLASKENIESNTGFFLLLIIFVIFIIVFIIFCSKGYNSLENKMDEVIHKKFQNEKKNKNNSLINNINNKKEVNKILSQNTKTSKKSKSKSNKKDRKESNTKTNKIKLNKTNASVTGQQNKNLSVTFNIKNNKNKKKENPNYKPDTDYELNWLSYKESIKYDKRTNCEYYGSLIRSKQLFIFTFCSFNDYNSGVIKKFMLFLSFALHYTVNALFFNESTMHQIYEDEGKFNFGYQISHIFVSAIISTVVLRLMLQFLVLTDNDVLKVKNQENKNMAIDTKKERLKCMKIKFAIFFVLNFILLGLFWYYLTCFNAVYKNTQVYLIENTFISFGFSLVYPFFINILPTLIRMSSIHDKNKSKEYLYKISQIIQIV